MCTRTYMYVGTKRGMKRIKETSNKVRVYSPRNSYSRRGIRILVGYTQFKRHVYDIRCRARLRQATFTYILVAEKTCR